ncbi:hypothetical protein BC826DRAFT_1012420 [Russula brevipes]|nr:hypothetical protein BC826DRAFT_1012420 [Russula brevipes]
MFQSRLRAMGILQTPRPPSRRRFLPMPYAPTRTARHHLRSSQDQVASALDARLGLSRAVRLIIRACRTLNRCFALLTLIAGAAKDDRCSPRHRPFSALQERTRTRTRMPRAPRQCPRGHPQIHPPFPLRAASSAPCRQQQQQQRRPRPSAAHLGRGARGHHPVLDHRVLRVPRLRHAAPRGVPLSALAALRLGSRE